LVAREGKDGVLDLLCRKMAEQLPAACWEEIVGSLGPNLALLVVFLLVGTLLRSEPIMTGG
jgi:hypothetical protein